MEEEKKLPIGKDEVRKAAQTLRKYKEGKSRLEDKIVRNEKWWQIRHWDLIKTEETKDDPKPASGWLFNTIISKHADYMDSIPSCIILPREQGDVEEADRLSSVIPVVMEQNGYRDVYSDEIWYKLKHGTGVYGVFWDPSKAGGMGDIDIESMDLLNLFWEPGVRDIQKSKNFFCVQLMEKEDVEASYPDVKGKLSKGHDSTVKKYMFDESIDTSSKVAVIDWYYKKIVDGKTILHFCKFVGDYVLYATENDTELPTEQQEQPVLDEMGNLVKDAMGNIVTQMVPVPTGEAPMSERGLYDHGEYPFVFDVLFPEAGMPIGLGFVDICKNAQASIDIYNNAFEKNIQFAASPRYFVRSDGGINEEEFTNPNEMMVHIEGNLGEDSIRTIDAPVLVNGNYISLLSQKIEEMKETAGNRDVANGGTTSGVTAASAINAMVQSSGKTSRDQINRTYDAYKKVVLLVIELIRQFYTMPRQFRITGKKGEMEFTEYSNAGLRPVDQGMDFGVDMGSRTPLFDIDVKADKENAYTQLSQNELALQFYNLGFFNPQMVDQALACIDMMDFSGKKEVVETIQQNGGMAMQLAQAQMQTLQMAEIIDRMSGGKTNMAEQVAASINGGMAAQAPRMGEAPSLDDGEGRIAEKAKAQAAEATSPV